MRSGMKEFWGAACFIGLPPVLVACGGLAWLGLLESAAALRPTPPDALKRRRPPQPAWWEHPDEQPGGPGDPVHALKLRPCRDLYDVVVHGLHWLARLAIRMHVEDNTRLYRLGEQELA